MSMQNPFSTPELVQAARKEADTLVDEFLQNPEDPEVVNDILHCGDAEMYSKSLSLQMLAMGGGCTEHEELSAAELEIAATRLQAMLHTGTFLMERLGREKFPEAANMKDIVRASHFIVWKARDDVVEMLHMSEQDPEEEVVGTETNEDGPSETSLTPRAVLLFLILFACIVILIRTCG